MRVLVTGGAGFIGATTASALCEAGHEVRVLDDLSTGHRDAVPDDATFVQADVSDASAVTAALTDFPAEACVHFAARIEAGASMRHPEQFFRANVGATTQLLDVLLAHDVRRFVLSSTAAVYGEPRVVPVTEDAPTSPTNPYGASKAMVEDVLAWLHRLRGLAVASLRYFNAAGATPGRPERHDPETHLIPRILDVAAGRTAALTIHGTDYPTPDGTAVRDYVHVADLADAHVRAVERLDNLGHLTANLGNGRGFSVREVVAAVERVTGRPVPTVDGPRRAGDPAQLVASAERARSVLGWQPRRPDIDDIVSDAWSVHRTG